MLLSDLHQACKKKKVQRSDSGLSCLFGLVPKPKTQFVRFLAVEMMTNVEPNGALAYCLLAFYTGL